MEVSDSSIAITQYTQQMQLDSHSGYSQYINVCNPSNSDESDDDSIIYINDVLLKSKKIFNSINSIEMHYKSLHEDLPPPVEELLLLSNYSGNSENFIFENSIINQDILEVEFKINVNYLIKYMKLL
ncbi:7264_t:CDS:2 [Funneliformis mosseae]|uniref:7264_t:CDS:1 n=1 Tax=Funneliformis mosseae TaxID=27381 RepID=A0A9N9DLT4_FUNMO|nr:7264_t:CDS:2 [Funneliformis mosseae]